MSKPVILTGLRANNDLTIGNYFGGILPIIDMARMRADDYQINMFVPDLHSFTTPIDFSQLKLSIMNNLRVYAAAGLPLEHGNVNIYRQSYIPAHSELTWILDCFSGMGEMRRMTQFKEKSHSREIAQDLFTKGSAAIDLEKISGSVSVGLFNYPVLMAADILLYNAEYVPVGEDQTQHLEFTRDIAARLNNQFGGLFTVPLPVKKQHEFFGAEQGLRIKDLFDPSKKMSKSDDSDKGVIFLSDAPEQAVKKVMSATTDNLASVNFDKTNQPGISNLLEILALLQKRPLDDVINEFSGMERYGDFKKLVADEVAKFLNDFQINLNNVDDEVVYAKLTKSEAELAKTANQTLNRVQTAIGLR